MYVNGLRLFPTRGMEGQREGGGHPHHPKICSYFPPVNPPPPVDFPNQIFIPPPKVNSLLLNNNFHANPIKTSSFAVVIVTVPFLF